MNRLALCAGLCRILHIGRNADSARMVRKALVGSATQSYEIEWVPTLGDGLDRLAAGGLTSSHVNAVLLDLALADGSEGQGLETLLRAAPTVPIVVIGTDETEETASRIMQAGAFEYLLTSHLDNYWLPRAVHHAIEWKRSEGALFDETERAEVTLNSIGDALLITNPSGHVTYLNSRAELMTGWPRVDAAGRPLADVLRIVDGVTRDPVEGLAEPADPPSDASSLVSDCILVRRDGSESAVEHSALLIHDRLGHVTGAAIVLHDVSAAHVMSVRMSHLASHDPLTDLPNRFLLKDRLDRALALAQRHDRKLAVLYLDIDHFKYINDSLGHPLGDQLLQIVGRAVTTCVRSSDTVSRQGGDEFVVVLAELRRGEDAVVGANKIIGAVTQPHAIDGHELHITVSIGISVYPNDGRDAETLLKCADMALYHAKAQGRNGYQFFEPALNTRAVERQEIETGLHGALGRQEFELFYQPKLNLKTGGVVGAEALIRWRHPNLGLVEPAQFVGVAEDCGLIRPIGRWVVHEACRQARAWQDAGLPPTAVSVNVSALEFRNRDFVANIMETLAGTRLDPRYLEIELTESVLMADVSTTTSLLRSLKNLGIQLAIDDFGTGWSSLSYLRHFPVDVLKIDKSFVQEIASRASTAPIVSAVIGMARSLNRRVIAEGVETSEQLAFLQAEECDEGQGFYLGRPVAAWQFASGLESTNLRSPVRLRQHAE